MIPEPNFSFPINDFNRYIDQSIQDRGLHYFLDSRVKEVKTEDEKLKRAEVSGTNDYIVEFELNEGILTSHQCTCPYAEKAFCKHKAAFIFHLQRERLDIRPLREI